MLTELISGKSGTFFAFLIIYCFHFSGAQAHYGSSAPCFEKYHLEQCKVETGILVTSVSSDSQYLKASSFYDFQDTDSSGNSTGDVPLPDIFSLNLPVDSIDTHQVKHTLNIRLPSDPEVASSQTIVLDSFHQSPLANIILSHLRTVILLN